MSSMLERRLQRAFARLPQPGREAGRRARASALATIPSEAHWRGLGVGLAAAAVALVLGAAAAALAASGNLHVRLGRVQPRSRLVPNHLQVPPGTHGIALLASGKLWLTTQRGLRIEGMPVSAAELSPRALYAVVGVGSSLVAFAPGQRRAWTEQTEGQVVAAAWSPDGLKIAYVVRRRHGFELRLIEGDGDHDRLLAAHVLPVKPSWRADALAVGYVDAAGRAASYEATNGFSRTFDTRACTGRVRAVAYAPRERALAVGGRGGVAIVRRWDRRGACDRADASAGTSLAWARTGIVSKNALARAGSPPVVGVTTRPDGSSLALVVRLSPALLQVELAGLPTGTRAVAIIRPLVRLRAAPARVSISWR
jgi:hypothetical protein